MVDQCSDVKTAFAHYLSDPKWDWTWFLTQTFDPAREHTHYNRKRDRFYGRLCEHSWRDLLKYVGTRANHCWGFMFTELHKNGHPHWHALLHVQEDLFERPARSSVWRYMFQRFGWNRVDPVRKGDVSKTAHGVCRYLTKYIAKEAAGGDATWDFGGYLGGTEADTGQIVRASGVDVLSF